MDRTTISERLSLAERHVSEASARVERQRELIKKLECDGHDTDEALGLLSQFEELQKVHTQDRDRLLAELAECELYDQTQATAPL